MNENLSRRVIWNNRVISYYELSIRYRYTLLRTHAYVCVCVCSSTRIDIAEHLKRLNTIADIIVFLSPNLCKLYDKIRGLCGPSNRPMGTTAFLDISGTFKKSKILFYTL